MPDLEKLANILGADTVKKIYEDGGSQPVQEISKVAVDVIKAFRLFTAPVQLAAAYQDRLTRYLEKVRGNVKEENQIEAPASIAGPVLDRVKYLEDGNYLTDLYLNLLSRAIDKERINEAHPAFVHLIDQLSPDEAYFLFLLKDKEVEIVTYTDYDALADWFSNRRITKSDIPIDRFNFPKNFDMYYSHLESLSLVTWPVYDTKYPTNEENVQIGIEKFTKILLTDFGKLFVNSCIPEKGFMMYK
ncbi:MAG: Abi-alpha family protein [Pedobacter sp.]|uniref:Abi-alpha family protein n=1 Tax=Pedobacter sp. TaxID=1411316 RepID=UPI00356701D5